MTTYPEYKTDPWFINSTVINGFFLRGEEDADLTPLYVTNERGEYAIFLEMSNEYLVKQVSTLEDGALVTFECAIRKFPNGHYLILQSVNTNFATMSGNIIRVDEPTVHGKRAVINFGLSQSNGKEDSKAVVISCSYWYNNKKDETKFDIKQKIVEGNFVGVSGSLKTGSYEKDGEEIFTLGIEVNHIATPKTSAQAPVKAPQTSPTGKVLSLPSKLGKPRFNATTPIPVAAGKSDDDIAF